MEILFCGTAAAEGWPALFCECRACQEARRLGGKNVRSRAAYMLGERIRIDFGPDSNLHQQNYGLAYEKLEHLLVTHSHDDHWFPTDLGYRRSGFSVVSKLLHVWGNEAVEKRFVDVHGADWKRYHLEYHRPRAWEAIDLGEGVSATPVLAAHDRNEECVNYRVETGGRAVLFGHDTGWYDEPTWEFLGRNPVDLLILDCTYGREENQRGHLGCAAVVRARDELAKRGGLAPDARCVATHFSHNGGALYEELEAYFKPHGIPVAYDGLRLTL